MRLSVNRLAFDFPSPPRVWTHPIMCAPSVPSLVCCRCASSLPWQQELKKMECKQHKDVKKTPQCKQRNQKNPLPFWSVRVDENRRPRRPGVMKLSEEGRAGVITVLQARESDFRNQRKRPPSTKRGWLWKTGAGPDPHSSVAVFPLRFFFFFFATSENVNSFLFYPASPGRRCFFCMLTWFRQALHLIHVISLHVTSATWSRWWRRDGSGPGEQPALPWEPLPRVFWSRDCHYVSF